MVGNLRVFGRMIIGRNFYGYYMKKNLFYCGILMLMTSCWFPSREISNAAFIDRTNASPVQKMAMWDGCMLANVNETSPTSVRDSSDLYLDSDMLSSDEYKNAFSFGMSYCYLGKSVFTNNYTRSDVNIMGFKGDSIAYKAGM